MKLTAQQQKQLKAIAAEFHKKMQASCDKHGSSVTISTGDGQTIAEFKPKTAAVNEHKLVNTKGQLKRKDMER